MLDWQLEVVEKGILKARNDAELSRGGVLISYDKSRTTPLQNSVEAACRSYSLQVLWWQSRMRKKTKSRLHVQVTALMLTRFAPVVVCILQYLRLVLADKVQQRRSFTGKGAFYEELSVEGSVPKGTFRTKDFALSFLRSRAYSAIYDSWTSSDYTPRWSEHTEGEDAVLGYLRKFVPNLQLADLKKLS